MSRQLDLLTDSKPRSRLALWSICLLLVAGVGAFAAWYLWPNVWLTLAEQALQQSEPATARGYLERYHARRPGDANALLLLARAARNSDDYAGAERYLAEYENSAGRSSAGGLEWELLGVQQGDLAGSEEALKSSVTNESPRSVEILEALARGYDVSYRYGEEVKALDYLLKQDKTHVRAVILRGKMFERVRQLERAEEEFRHAVELAPKNPDALGGLASVQNRLGFTEEAIANYQAALQEKPEDPKLLLGLARAYLDAADLVEVERVLDQILSSHPDDADALLEKARLKVRNKQPAEAEVLLERAAKIAPWSRGVQSLQVLALKELGKSKELAEAERRLAELQAADAEGARLKLHARDNPRDMDVRMKLWHWCKQNGQLDDGLTWLTEILRSAPGHVQAQAALADYFDQVEQPRRAAQHRAKAQGSFQ